MKEKDRAMGLRSQFLVFCIVLSLALAAIPGRSAAAPAAEKLHYGPTGFTWPGTADWISVSTLNDYDDGLTRDHLDFVGNASYPGFYYCIGATYVYFRMRVDFGGPVILSSEGTPTFSDTITVMLDRGGNGTLDYGFAWDTRQSHGLEMMVPGTTGNTWNTTSFNDIDNNPGQKVAPPDINTTGEGYVRTVDDQDTGSGNFGTTTFIDFAVSWSYLAAQTLLTKSETWGIQIGSINNSNDHTAIDADVGGQKNPGDVGVTFPGSINSSPTAAVLSAFAAEAGRSGVTVTWETVSELGNLGFNLYRAPAADGPWLRLNEAVVPSRAPGSPEGFTYTWLDREVRRGDYWYRLSDIGLDGSETPLDTTHVRNGYGWLWLPFLIH